MLGADARDNPFQGQEQRSAHTVSPSSSYHVASPHGSLIVMGGPEAGMRSVIRTNLLSPSFSRGARKQARRQCSDHDRFFRTAPRATPVALNSPCSPLLSPPPHHHAGPSNTADRSVAKTCPKSQHTGPMVRSVTLPQCRKFLQQRKGRPPCARLLRAVGIPPAAPPRGCWQQRIRTCVTTRPSVVKGSASNRFFLFFLVILQINSTAHTPTTIVEHVRPAEWRREVEPRPPERPLQRRARNTTPSRPRPELAP
ncbi:hypothetical protein TCSYLVIO_008632 [Trypanosoma cruzi]|nr:hypothetical protein TCSYLVIO_008632 [Trypanosoma cruzi]